MPFITPIDQPDSSSLSRKIPVLEHSPHNDLDNNRLNTGMSTNNASSSEETHHLDGPRRIPTIRLDVDAITDMIAAKLATSLLGHVLFLKNQVPFPVTQLARIPGGQTKSRAAKLKRDLLESFDTLSSHLDTTFTALSTAFARCSKFRERDSCNAPPTGQAYLAILVGPSIGSAKSKVFFAVDGLEIKVWGIRDGYQVSRPIPEENSDETDEEDEEEEEEESDVEEEDTEDFEDDGDEEASEPEDSDEDSDSQDEGECSSRSSSPMPDPPRLPSKPTLMPVHPHAQEQQVIRTADRLLSRTLATADAEGYGMAAELAPTQTHILLRAPRRFKHPAWVPRQNVTNSLENSLSEFQHEAGFSKSDIGEHAQAPHSQGGLKSISKRGHKIQVEGVWVTGRTPMQVPGDREEVEEEDEEEDDEMIWWSWDGKIVGFSDW